MASFSARYLSIAVTALFCGLTNSSYASAADGKTLDLTNVGIVGAQDGSLPAKAVEILTDEIEKRTGIRVPAVEGAQKPETPSIVIQTLAQFKNDKLPDGLEPPRSDDSYAIWVDQTQPSPTVMLLGFDERATLYAAGRLLRLLSMTKGKLELPADVRISTAPDVAIRGHQLGFRETANSYDAWDLKQYEQYLRDLIVFGANAIELIPPVGPDEPRGPLMPLHPWEMNQKLSALIGSYGLDVWLWVPVEADVNDPKQAEEELNRMRTLFQSCSHISDIFVPGGDPGHTPPDILLPWLSRMAAALHETHPDADLWVSNQGFTPEQNEVLFNYLRTAEPDWLEGIVFGPWAKISLAEARARTPRKFRIRRYPDICHTLRCQYPAPDWDPAFCQALGREPYNPRPRAMAHIHNSMADLADGFVAYSDGITDDVNKAIWSASGWDRNQGVEEILSEYGRYFIGEEQKAKPSRASLLGLEENWRGPLLANENIEKTLAQWQEIEKQLPEGAQANWRLQLPILRAQLRCVPQTKTSPAYANRTGSERPTSPSLENWCEVSDRPGAAALAQVEDDDTAHDLRSKLVELWGVAPRKRPPAIGHAQLRSKPA